eukprot:13659604-Alexandrium_andersonii.AAC.1
MDTSLSCGGHLGHASGAPCAHACAHACVHAFKALEIPPCTDYGAVCTAYRARRAPQAAQTAPVSSTGWEFEGLKRRERMHESMHGRPGLQMRGCGGRHKA